MIEIYGTEGCFYCNLSKDLLEGRGIDYQYIDVAHDVGAMKLFKEHSFKSVPQVFVDNTHIGGYNELREYLREIK